MAKQPKPEEIVAKLRQADVLISQGQSVAEAIGAIGVSEVTYGSVLHGPDQWRCRIGRHRKPASLIPGCALCPSS